MNRGGNDSTDVVLGKKRGGGIGKKLFKLSNIEIKWHLVKITALVQRFLTKRPTFKR
jgi:hypothetical protein